MPRIPSIAEEFLLKRKEMSSAAFKPAPVARTAKTSRKASTATTAKKRWAKG